MPEILHDNIEIGNYYSFYMKKISALNIKKGLLNSWITVIKSFLSNP